MALATKYRPQRFTDLVGQHHVVVVIKALLRRHFAEQGLPAGLLFSGTKGTGKTTSARVVAATLNCQSEYAGDPRYDVEPCCACENCHAVRKSNCLFVHEIDAASTGTVDEVRKIKEITSLSHAGNVRVIILDEAHSMSRSAFEALLKQLEEPQPNVLYILCTTEVERLPETILSRLMQFSFKQVVPELVTVRLQQIVIAENIQVADAKVLMAIATKAQGAMRDAITMMEQLASYRTPLTHKDFLEYYGLVSSEVATRLLDCARTADIVGAKELIVQNFTRGVDLGYFLDDFMIGITEALQNKRLTANQVVECYKAAVEVKSKLKYMPVFVAANYLFALLLRAFSHEGNATSMVATKESLQELFQ